MTGSRGNQNYGEDARELGSFRAWRGCRAAVVLQKSSREGFGLTVTDAMWKGTPVTGGQVAGIRHHIQDGVNGFLVESVEQQLRKSSTS